MTDADPIEPVSDEDPAAPGTAELARIRAEVRAEVRCLALQVQALAAEVDRSRRLLTAGLLCAYSCSACRSNLPSGT